MANIFELNINLNSNEKSEAEKALEATTSGGSSSDKKDSKELSNLEMAGKMLAGIHFADKVKSNVVNPLINLGISTVGNIYGDTARVNQINNFRSTIDGGVSLVRSGLSGYSVGKAFGGSAGGWLALINVALDLAGTAIEMVQNANEYNNRQLDYKYNSAYSQERLGLLALNKGR